MDGVFFLIWMKENSNRYNRRVATCNTPVFIWLSILAAVHQRNGEDAGEGFDEGNGGSALIVYAHFVDGFRVSAGVHAGGEGIGELFVV